MTKKRNEAEAAVVLKAAAGLATTVIASAASDATKAVAAAADNATKAVATAASLAATVVTEAAVKALLEFPRLQEDIRELRAAQSAETAAVSTLVTNILTAHTSAEEEKLESIGKTVTKVEAHMAKQNSRLDKAESHIIRQNLVIFGIAGPVCLIAIGYFINALLGQL